MLALAISRSDTQDRLRLVCASCKLVSDRRPLGCVVIVHHWAAFSFADQEAHVHTVPARYTQLIPGNLVITHRQDGHAV